MVSNALALAIATTTGFIIVYKKLPRKVRKFIEKHDLLTDFVCLILTYILLGGTLTALFAASLVGLFTSALLYIANHPDDFEFLRDFIGMVKEKLGQLGEVLRQFGQHYREEKLLRVPGGTSFTEQQVVSVDSTSS